MADNEFGHDAIVSKDFCIDAWGVGPFVIEVGGKSYRFEDSDRFGPALIKENGDPLTNPWPPERCPFWRAHRLWRRQGRRTHEDGITCRWDEPRPMFVRRFDKRTCLIVENGEEDGIVHCAGCRKRIRECRCV